VCSSLGFRPPENGSMPGIWPSLSHNWATARTIAGDANTIWQPGLLLKPVAIELGLATGLRADQAIGLAGDGSQPQKPSFAQQLAGFWAVANFAATSTLRLVGGVGGPAPYVCPSRPLQRRWRPIPRGTGLSLRPDGPRALESLLARRARQGAYPRQTDRPQADSMFTFCSDHKNFAAQFSRQAPRRPRSMSHQRLRSPPIV
jgi:hypothetical protein